MKKAGRRFLFFGFAFLFLLIVMGSYIGYATIRTSKFIAINEEISSLNYYIKQYLLNVGDFIENAYLDQTFVKTGASESLTNAIIALDSASVVVNSLSKGWYADFSNNSQLLMAMAASIKNNRLYCEQLSTLFQEKGFKDLGLEGKMRSAIHDIEHYPVRVNMENLLTLRRHEKDFLLRKDEAYINKFKDEIAKFKEAITQDERFGELDKEKLFNSLDQYVTCFDKIVIIEKKIGFNKSNGLKLLIRTEHTSFESLYIDMSDEIKLELQQLSTTTYVIITALFIMLLFLLTSLVIGLFYYQKFISQPILMLERSAAAVAKGNLSQEIDAENSSRLLKEVFISFNKIIEKIKLTINQIEDVANRKIKEPIILNDENDDIGISLNKVIAQIKSYDQQEAIRRWEAEGVALFSNLVRTASTLKELCDVVLPQIIKYLEANQGGLFVLNEQKDALILYSSYAYNRKKFLDKEIKIGEGLIGQTYLEKELVYITEIPEGYIYITSGMGDAEPNALVIVPLINNEQVEAVLEIANFKKFTSYEQQFLLKIGETIASAIHAIKTTENTQRLLKNYNQFSVVE